MKLGWLLGRRKKSETRKYLEREWKKRQKAYNSPWGKYIESQLRLRGFEGRLEWGKFRQLLRLVRGHGKKIVKPHLDRYGSVPFYKEYGYIHAIKTPRNPIKTLKPIKLKKSKKSG